mmetsp:Transcript_2130/g.2819  ORF Transcript_2130/g.2819 Transcript_2130/m.2819 type:complete len:128 (-) Transcript_2130:656-1039(-)
MITIEFSMTVVTGNGNVALAPARRKATQMRKKIEIGIEILGAMVVKNLENTIEIVILIDFAMEEILIRTVIKVTDTVTEIEMKDPGIEVDIVMKEERDTIGMIKESVITGAIEEIERIEIGAEREKK